MGIDQAERKTTPCRYCLEPMDVRAVICPHCRRETLGFRLRREVLRVVLPFAFVVLISPFLFWFCVSTCGYIGKHLFDGIQMPAHSQPAHRVKPAHKDKPKAH